MDEKKPAEFTIEDFVANESFLNYHLRTNKEDEIFWEKWLLTNPSKIAFAEEARATLDLLFLRLPADEYQLELERIRKKLSKGPVQYKNTSLVRFLNWNKATGTRSVKGKKRKVYLVAAVLVLAAVGYLFMQRSSFKNDALSEKHNTGSSPLEFVLSDGTVVTLAAKSTLRYQKLFGNSDRKVYLNGEAAFHVSKDEAHPFKVYADELVATVLGTTFNVKEEQGGALVLVELLEGKVKVETGNTGSSIILNPNERVVYTRLNHSMYKEVWQPLLRATAIPQNHLVFRKDNFTTVALKMKTVFGITLINQSNKKGWRFTGEFNNTTAKDIIETICLIEHLKYDLNGDTILIK